MRLTGRTILITGGSAGIGLAFALKFLELGNEVIVTGRRQALLNQVKAKYPKLHTIQSDVAGPGADRRPCGAREIRFPQARRADEQCRPPPLQEPQVPGRRPDRVNGGDERQRGRCRWNHLRAH